MDAAGAVVALDNLTLEDETLTNGQASALWDIVSFSAPSYGRELMDPSFAASTFVLDGSGSVVALDNLSLYSPTSSSDTGIPIPLSPVYELVRLLPGPTSGSFVTEPMTAQ